jgi:hypothetical protein
MRIQTEIQFIIEYDDGRTARMKIPGSDLERGDHVARKIAGERQLAGELP